jgi:hypothetical protein
MSSYELSDPQERQQYQNMKVLWGLYSSSTIIQNESGGKADDVASILTSIVPLFIILCLCFIQKELDRWVTSNFNVTIHLNVSI